MIAKKFKLWLNFVSLPAPLPMGESGPPDGGPGEGSVADRTGLLGGPRLLATTSRRRNFWSYLGPKTEEGGFIDMLTHRNA
ncbi:MAG: hypothetical protein DMG06_04015 [Acidobacteria bacterium]|nr:MAG: hypothetical protein DMG06_04015 [Acidobacteriota bacterium]